MKDVYELTNGHENEKELFVQELKLSVNKTLFGKRLITEEMFVKAKELIITRAVLS